MDNSLLAVRDINHNYIVIERGKKMRTVSSYGVELRKQNIPIRQTLDIYRSAVSCLPRHGMNWKRSRNLKNVSILQNIWCIPQKRIRQGLILTCDFQRCLLISEGQLSSMPWEVYPHIRRGWNCGIKWIRKAARRSWCVVIMPCRYFTVM